MAIYAYITDPCAEDARNHGQASLVANLRTSVEHTQNFLDCVRSRKTPNSDITTSHYVSTTCHLANISLRTGHKIKWDAERQEILDDPIATKMLHRPYRAPWDKELKSLLKS